MILLTKLKSKIHRATVTSADIDYEGSCAIDRNLMIAAGIEENEQVHVFNVNNGERFITYALTAYFADGTVAIKGPAARKVMPGDLIIICAYAQVPPGEDFQPKLVFVNEDNFIEQIR
jgi:aspartate 1-decarboxylase